MWIRALAVWLFLSVLAVSNGVVRKALLAPRFGEHAGHVISTLVLCAVIFGVAWLSSSWMGAERVRDAAWIGVFWVGLTLAFEWLAGHYLFGNSWGRLAADYNVLRGRVWVLVLLATALAPAWAAHVRR